MAEDLSRITDALLTAAKSAGADAADAVALESQSIAIDVRAGVLEQAERSESIDLGLRVLIGQKQAIVSSSDTRADTLIAMAERAVAMAAEAPDDPYCGLADPVAIGRAVAVASLDLADAGPDPSPDMLQTAALEAEAAALSVKGVSQVQSASASHGRQRVHLAATNGLSDGYDRSSQSVFCVAISGQGTDMERDYDGDSRTYAADLRSAVDIGQSAGTRAIAMQGARQPATGTFPVLFDERISSSLIGHLLAASNGAAVARGASWLRDAMGEQVLPAHLSVIEDPHRPRIGGSRPFDGEGLPTRKRSIVEDGHLTGWTLDLTSARKLGLQSTANAARGTSAPPSPANWNIDLTPGTHSRADLIADMGTGLLVTSMIGSTINPNTGDYSRGASGFWVENGTIAYPVNECTIAGNLRDMLMRIVPANDARFYLSRRVPSILIDGMTLAGQ